MTAINQLKQYGFLVTPELERILKKLPANTFNDLRMDKSKGMRIARIWCDDKNTTDIVITQKI